MCLHFKEGYGERRIEQVLPIGHTTASRWIANFVIENEINPHGNLRKIFIEEIYTTSYIDKIESVVESSGKQISVIS